jgi:CRP/FNR family transcriptional regulator, anaerobic regulatory protein
MKKAVPTGVDFVPSLGGLPFLPSRVGNEKILLTDRQRHQLAAIGMRVRLPARKLIYREGAPAQWIFAVDDGVIKSYKELSTGKRSVAAFMFPRDLFGLAEQGHYVNSLQAITAVTLYRFGVDELTSLLKADGEMQFAFLVKVTHELRVAQRRTILVNRRDAAGRLAMFVVFVRNHLGHGDSDEMRVPLPMSRTDIAGFVGLSLESVSRAAAELERRGLVEFEGRHWVRIVDSARLMRLAAAV